MAIQRIPVWKEMENWHKRQQAMRDFLEANAALADNMISAGSIKAEGLAEIVANTALKRIQAEAAAKHAKATAQNAQTTAEDKALQAIKDRMTHSVKLYAPEAKTDGADKDDTDTTIDFTV